MPQETITLTVNERLARHHRLGHAAARRAAGETVCEAPPIRSWHAWLREQHARLLDGALAGRGEAPPALLTPAQADAVWEQVIRDSAAGAGLLQLPATARAAHEAWSLAHAWQLPAGLLEASDFADVRAFAAWSRAFAVRCEAEYWLDDARLADCITAAIAERRLPVPAAIGLAGFDEFTPQQRRLLETLEAAGCRIETQDPAPAAAGRARRLACADAAEEVRAAADWAARCLRAEPAARIGIVVPDLAARRAALQRALDESLAPARRLDEAQSPPPWNLSLGTALAEAPLVHAALLALRCAGGRITAAQAGALLRSPYFSGATEERDRRALLDAHLREQGRTWLGPGALAEAAARFRGCEVLAERLARARELQAGWPSRQSPGAWVAAFSAWLGALGWPHGRSLDSAEYQSFQAWQELLSGFAALGAVTGHCTAGEALARLSRMARDSLFQPRTPAAQVEVLGTLEAGGLTFDHLWVMGLHDNAWPAAPRPNPFLPVHWQREAGLPHASAARERALAEQRTAAFCTAAPDVVFSWPQREGDAELRPSPLLAGLDEAERSPPPAPLAAHWFAVRAREPVPVSQLPEVPAGTRARGGTWLLADQAACSFRATAVHRWQANALEQPGEGLDARDRGTLVHRIMAAIWDELHEHARLTALSESERESLIARCVRGSVDHWCRRHPGRLEGRFRAVEEARLGDLAREWLALETARGAFAVEPAEHEQRLAIGGLELKARPDRIDRLPDGGRLVVDYKTGSLRTGDWLGERPEAPQLPLYALANRDALAGVLIATLKTGNTAYDGVTREADMVPGVPGLEKWRNRPDGCESFDDLLAYWQRNLEVLAVAYRSGRVQVDPKKPPATCRYCHLGVLCRIDELRGAAQDLEAGESGTGDGDD